MILDRLYWSAYLARHLRGQGRYAFRPLAAVRRDQGRRVRRMAAYACRWVPYYRETMDRLGLDPSAFRCADDLARLPLIERRQLQREPGRFVSTRWPPKRHLCVHTSGTLGLPATVYHDLPSVVESAAHGERARAVLASAVGRRWPYREAMLLSCPSSAAQIRDLYRRLLWFPPGLRPQWRYLSIFDPPERNAQFLNDLKPDVLHSYGSYLAILFRYLHATGARFHRPRAIVYSSDGLPDPVRSLIMDTFRIPVFAWYGAAEAFKIGFECEQHLGLHVDIDLCPVRIVDAAGCALPAGEYGEVVISNLVNRGTVLLNYRLGDVAALLPGPCPCGRSLPLMSFPPGRTDDLIVLPSGRIVHPQTARVLLSFDGSIWEYQIVQESPTSLRVLAVAGPACERESTRRRLQERIADALEREVTVNVVFVDTIDRTAAGKHRHVVSKLERPDVRLWG